MGQNAAVWGSSDSQSGRAVCFKWVELKELCPKGAEGEAAVKIETLLQEVAPKRLLPKLKQLCGRKKWLGLPVILAANSTSNLCTPGKLFPYQRWKGKDTFKRKENEEGKEEEPGKERKMGKTETPGKFPRSLARPVLREGLWCHRSSSPAACRTGRACSLLAVPAHTCRRGFSCVLLFLWLARGPVCPGRRRGGRDKSGYTFLPFCRSSNLYCMMMHLIFNL